LKIKKKNEIRFASWSKGKENGRETKVRYYSLRSPGCISIAM